MTGIKAGITAFAIALGGIAAVNGVAYAATGHALMLGTANHAAANTSLSRTTNGAALTLNVRPGSAPLAVNSTARVAKLNADLIDGLHASDLQLHAIKYLVPTTAPDVAKVAFPGMPNGVYLASFSVEVYSATADDHIGCAIGQDSGPDQIVTTVTLNGHYGFVDASGVLDAQHGTFHFACGRSGGPMNLVAGTDSSISMTPISSVTVANATP